MNRSEKDFKKMYDSDKAYDKQYAINQLKEFIENLKKSEITYYKNEPSENLWIEIPLENISNEKREVLNELLSDPNINFKVIPKEKRIICTSNPIKCSY